MSLSLGASWAEPSGFAWAHCQKTARAPHCNDVPKTANLSSLSSLTPVIPVLLNSLMLCSQGLRSFQCSIPATTHAQRARVPLVGSVKCSLICSWYFMKLDQCPSRLTSELPFYCYRSNRKNPWLSTFRWKAICGVSVPTDCFSPKNIHISNIKVHAELLLIV